MKKQCPEYVRNMSRKCTKIIMYTFGTYSGHIPNIRVSGICSKTWSFPDIHFVRNTSLSWISQNYYFTGQFMDIFRTFSWYFRDIWFFQDIFRTFSGHFQARIKNLYLMVKFIHNDINIYNISSIYIKFKVLLN